MTESAIALGIATDTLIKIETKSTELSDESVTAAYYKWREHVAKIAAARRVVNVYLLDSKAGADVTGPYSTGTKLLADMDHGFRIINQYWADMVSVERTVESATFVALFRKDIERFKVLERKFDEWISQFRVRK
jgi:hypothetical protein